MGDSDLLQLDLLPNGGSIQTHIWPPSPQSAPFLSMLILGFVVLVKKTLFNSQESSETRRVRDVKRRLLLAQMTQALRWADEDAVEEEETKDGKKDKENEEKSKTKRPPPVADLFEMVY